MKKRPVRCPCGQKSEIVDSSTMSDQMASTDFTPYMEISNGITMIWICPACEVVTRKAVEALVLIFKKDAEYIHLARPIRAAVKRLEEKKEQKQNG